MAVANAMALDLTETLKQAEKMDKHLEKWSDLSEKIARNLQKGVSAKGKKGGNTAISKISEDAKKSIDDVNKLANSIDKVLYKGKTYSNSALTKVNKDIEEATKKLTELDKLLKFYTKGEGQKAIGFVDLSGLEKESKALMNHIQMLERKRESIKANARLRLTLADRQRERDSAWFAMEQNKANVERRNAEESSRRAREISKNAQKSYEEQMKAYEKMFNEIDKKERDRQKRAEQTIARERQQASRALAQFKANSVKDANWLLGQQGQAKSLDELKAYAKELQRTMATLDPKSKEWKKLNKALGETNNRIGDINKRMRGFQQESERARGITEQLRRSLMLMFSLSQISGYIKKLVSVRGEFELQQRSLEAILQNKEEANKIWNQTVDLAVRSPFQLKELVTYTKQLAAYRVETEKLHDTTKMLADVSAGLGVDMQRLILAYGQVKAANYLRGTELRQFSEAGINILDELATYFSELENRAISVGEVFQMVSKRMVSFADVEEIFKRITSEGGTFYNMQELQAETLKGQISNFKDSLDIMLNDIGRSQEGMLKDTIRLVRRMLETYEDWSAFVLPTLAVFLSRWALVNVISKRNWVATKKFFSDFIKGLRGVNKGFGLLNSWSLIIGVVVAGIWTLVRALNAVNKVAKELNKIELKGLFDASKMSGDYARLANIVSDITKSYDEQKKALDELKRKYDDILPAHLLEAKTIQSMSGDYRDATQAINDYIAAKTKERQIEYVESEYGEKTQTKGEDLAKRVYKKLKDEIEGLTQSDINVVVARFRQEVEQGLVDNINANERFKELLEEYLGTVVNEDAWKLYIDKYNSATGDETTTLAKDWVSDFVSSLVRMKDEIDNVTNSNVNFGSKTYRELEEIKKGYEEVSNSVIGYINIIKGYNDPKNTLITEEQYNDAISKLNDIYGENAPKWSEIINDPFKLKQATIDTNVNLWQKMINEINGISFPEGSKETKNNFLELLGLDIEKFKGEEFQREVMRVADIVSKQFNQSFEGLSGLLPSTQESRGEYAKRLEEKIKEYETEIRQQEIDLKKGGDFADDKRVERMKEQLPMLKEFLTYFYMDDNKDSNKDIFEERLRILKEMYDAYKDLNKTFDETKSKEGVLEKYGQAFREAYGFDAKEWGDFFISDGAYNVALDKLKNLAKDAKDRLKVELESGRVTLDAEIQLKKDQDKDLMNDLKDMLDDYEAFKELEKLGISKEFASKLFGVDAMDLSQIKEVYKQALDQFIGTDMEGEYRTMLDNITKLEQQEQQERLKTYLKYTRKAISERAQIEFDAMRKMAEARKTFDKDDPLLQDALKGIKREMNEALQALDWKEFSSSDTFVNIFNDLENVSTQALNTMIDQLEEYKKEWTNLPIDQMEAVAKQLEKMKKARDINEAVANPFASGAFAGGRLKAKDISQAQQGMLSADASILASNKEVSNMEYLLEMLYEEKSLADQDIVSQERLRELGIDITKSREDQVKTIEEIVTKEQKNINTQKQNKQNAQNILDLAEKQKAVLEAQSKYLGKSLQMANDLYDAFRGLYEALGGDEDNAVAIFADMGMQMANTVIQTIQLQIQLNIATQSATGFALAMNTAMGVIGWIVMAVQLLTQAITAITKVHDNRLQVQIERDADAVELLTKRYEELEKAIESAMSFHKYESQFNEMQQNLEEQIRLTEAMIKAEEDKKKTDTDQIKSWNEEIDEANKLLKENEEARIEAMGGFGSEENLYDAAQSFVDAWIDAYKETGDGLDALKEQWDEYFDNIIKKQMMMRVASKYIEPFLGKIDEALRDNILTGDEMEKLKTMADESSTQLNAIMQQLAEAIGFESGSTGSELEGLSKNIQGVTEVTAQALEAILNSMRFYVIDNNKQLIEMVNRLAEWEAPSSPILAELKAQTRHLEDIRDFFNSVINRQSGNASIRVTM